MIVVTTPTGQIGGQLVDTLLTSTGEPVRVVVRDRSRLPAHVAAAADVVEGSHGDPETLARAFDGADSVFWVVPTNAQAPSVYAAYVGFSIPAAQALVDHAVSRVVVVSALGRGHQGFAGHVSGSLALEDLFRSTGVHLRALNLPSFMDNLLWQVGAMKATGAFYSGIDGDLRLPSVATRDIAAEACRLLANPTWTGQESHPVLGPADLSFKEIAEILTDVLETPIRFQQVAPEEYRDGLVQRGQSPQMADGMLAMALGKNAGIDTMVERTAENTTPTTFRQFCEDTLKPAFERA